MALVWGMSLPDSQKIVLLALADSANDEGHCWPSMRALCIKTSKSERTVQGVIKELCEAGHLTRREVPGKGCNYSVHPRNDCAPAEAATPPAETAGHPRSGCGQTVKEPSKNRKSTPAEPVRGGKTIIPDDWKVPAKADLPPKARALAEQWTDASYETHAEAFHGYWRSCRRMNADWLATWANRVVALHSQVMRDQKFGNAPTDAPVPDVSIDPLAQAEKTAALYRRMGREDDAREEEKRAARLREGGGMKPIGAIVGGFSASAPP